MKLYSENKEYKLYHGSMLDMLEVIEPNSIDAIITDPPYELNFMSKGWDNSGIAFQPSTWQKCYEVLKPGGYLLAFGGSRTFHRIACAIEDAGFEIRDTIMWLYGSGFPKSMALDKALEGKITTGNANKTQFHKLSGEQEDKHHYGFTTMNKEQGFRPKDYTIEGKSNTYLKKLEPTTDLAKKYSGWGTTLKPSFEPIIVARKSFKGSLVDNVVEYGVGGLNIDECRVENTNADSYDLEKRGISKAKGSDNDGHFLDKLHNQDAKHGVVDNGRFPANVILTYDETDFDEVCGGMPNTKSNGSDYDFDFTNQDNPSHLYTNIKSGKHFEDEGSVARYFYCAKASKFDRDEGLDSFEEQKSIRINAPREKEEDKFSPKKNIHPTVKPISLMRYLVRLVSPKGATILDCFNGSGSTGKAVMLENKEFKKNYKYIGIELTDEYLPIAKARIEYICNNEFDFTEEENGIKQHEVVKKDSKILDIFDFGVEL